MFTQILNLLRSDGSIVVNKTLARNIGLNEAIIYSELASKFIYYLNENKLTQDSYFYYTVEDMENDTTLTKYLQSKAIDKLVSLGLIDKKIRKAAGQEAPLRYFTINPDVSLILKYLSDKAENKLEILANAGKLKIFTFQSQNTEQSKVEKMDTNNTNNIILNNNTKLKSVSQSMTPETPPQNQPQKKDRPTDDYSEMEEYFKERIGYHQIVRACLGGERKDTSTVELLDEILLNILDMYYSEYTTVNKDRKPQAIIRGVLHKLDYWRVSQVMEQYKSITTEIKNVKGYLQTSIYNSVFEFKAKVENFKNSTYQE